MLVPIRFWGLVVEPNKLYSQTVPVSFKVTMASLGTNEEVVAVDNKPSRSTLVIKLDDKEEFSVCSLTTGKLDQQPIDLVLNESEVIAFRVEGTQNIHLTGYYLNTVDQDMMDEDDEEFDEEFDDEETDSEEDDEFDSEEDDEEDASDSDPRIEVVESDEEEDEEDDESDLEDSEEDASEEDQPTKRSISFNLPETKKTKETPIKVSPPPAQPAKQDSVKQEPKQSQQPQQQKQVAQNDQAKASVKKTLPSGLQIEDLKLGNGPKAAQGKKVLIHYKGTLMNGKVFDSSFGKQPLKFAVGKGDVIKGMDVGIAGMAVGGSRKLVIPANLAYGSQSLPGIPANSTLVFEIRLEKVL